MKICFIQYSLAGGGAERKICTLANYFVSKGHTVEIGLFGHNEIAYKLDSRIKITSINRDTYKYKNYLEKILYKFRLNFITFSEKICKKIYTYYVKKLNYTEPIVSFINHRKDFVFITMMVQTYDEIMSIIDKNRLDYIKDRYIVMECNNPTVGLDTKTTDEILRNKYYPMAKKIVSMNNGIKNCFNQEIQLKSVIIPNPINNELTEPYYGERNKTIVTYCRLNEQKNLPFLINAFSKILKEYQDYRLEIYGKGSLKDSLIKQIEDLSIRHNAFIYDFDPNIHEKIKKSAMFVLSSDYEGQPNGLMEAMAIGLPCISTDCDFGPRDIINNYENGLLVPCNDVDALYYAIKEFIDNPDLAKKCGREAVKVREEYSVEKIGDKWLDLINEI